MLGLQPLLVVVSSSHRRWLITAAPVQVLREEKLLLACQHYIGQTLGSEFTEPRPWQLDDVFPDTTAATPIIFILSSGADPTAMLQVGHSAASTQAATATAARSLLLQPHCILMLSHDLHPCCSRNQMHLVLAA